MTTNISRWMVPIAGVVLGLLIAAVELGRQASPAQAIAAFVVVAGYTIALRFLQSRSDIASLLSGLPRDERWASINLRALSLAAQVVAVALIIAFLATSFAGGDALPYTWVGGTFAVGYLGGLVWYRVQS